MKIDMLSNNIRLNGWRQRKHNLVGYRYTPTQKDKSIYAYGGYLPHSAEPKDLFDSSQNLFDDSESEEKRWLKIARIYLSRNR